MAAIDTSYAFDLDLILTLGSATTINTSVAIHYSGGDTPKVIVDPNQRVRGMPSPSYAPFCWAICGLCGDYVVEYSIQYSIQYSPIYPNMDPSK